MTRVDGVRKRRERGSIAPEDIIDAAFAVAERDSIDNLSVQEVAKHLDIAVTSVFWHFRKKENLLRAMSDEAIQAVQQLLPSPNTAISWRAFLEEYYTKMREVYRTNDVLADLVLIRLSEYSLASTHLTYQGVEKIVALLVSAGFSPVNAWRLNGTLLTYTRGIIISERTQRIQQVATIDERQSTLIVPQSMPQLFELVQTNSVSLSMASDDDFTFGLSVLLSGFEQLLKSDQQRVSD